MSDSTLAFLTTAGGASVSSMSSPSHPLLSATLILLGVVFGGCNGPPADKATDRRQRHRPAEASDGSDSKKP